MENKAILHFKNVLGFEEQIERARNCQFTSQILSTLSLGSLKAEAQSSIQVSHMTEIQLRKPLPAPRVQIARKLKLGTKTELTTGTLMWMQAI